MANPHSFSRFGHLIKKLREAGKAMGMFKKKTHILRFTIIVPAYLLILYKTTHTQKICYFRSTPTLCVPYGRWPREVIEIGRCRHKYSQVSTYICGQIAYSTLCRPPSLKFQYALAVLQQSRLPTYLMLKTGCTIRVNSTIEFSWVELGSVLYIV